MERKLWIAGKRLWIWKRRCDILFYYSLSTTSRKFLEEKRAICYGKQDSHSLIFLVYQGRSFADAVSFTTFLTLTSKSKKLILNHTKNLICLSRIIKTNSYPRVLKLIYFENPQWNEHEINDTHTFNIYLNWPGAAPNSPPPCLLAALDGANPSSFWIFWRIDMVHKI